MKCRSRCRGAARRIYAGWLALFFGLSTIFAVEALPEVVVLRPSTEANPAGEDVMARLRAHIMDQNRVALPYGLAELETRRGEIFRDAEVIRLEPDGLHLRHSGGIEKLPFEELPVEVHDVFRFDPDLAQSYRDMMAIRRVQSDASRRVSVAQARAREWEIHQGRTERLAAADQQRAEEEAERRRLAQIRAQNRAWADWCHDRNARSRAHWANSWAPNSSTRTIVTVPRAPSVYRYSCPHSISIRRFGTLTEVGFDRGWSYARPDWVPRQAPFMTSW